jgi:hypothetical protein
MYLDQRTTQHRHAAIHIESIKLPFGSRAFWPLPRQTHSQVPTSIVDFENEDLHTNPISSLLKVIVMVWPVE